MGSLLSAPKQVKSPKVRRGGKKSSSIKTPVIPAEVRWCGVQEIASRTASEASSLVMKKKTDQITAALVVLLLQVAAQLWMATSPANAAGEDFDEEGSGIGSGDDVGCIPPSMSDFPTIHEPDAVNEIRCHLACIDEVGA